MADNRIDKSLPNTLVDEKLPGEEVIEEVDIAEELGKKPIEVTPEEDGGATVDFDPQS